MTDSELWLTNFRPRRINKDNLINNALWLAYKIFVLLLILRRKHCFIEREICIDFIQQIRIVNFSVYLVSLQAGSGRSGKSLRSGVYLSARLLEVYVAAKRRVLNFNFQHSLCQMTKLMVNYILITFILQVLETPPFVKLLPFY